jgi:hypothetical protein
VAADSDDTLAFSARAGVRPMIEAHASDGRPKLTRG